MLDWKHLVHSLIWIWKVLHVNSTLFWSQGGAASLEPKSSLQADRTRTPQRPSKNRDMDGREPHRSPFRLFSLQKAKVTIFVLVMINEKKQNKKKTFYGQNFVLFKWCVKLPIKKIKHIQARASWKKRFNLITQQQRALILLLRCFSSAYFFTSNCTVRKWIKQLQQCVILPIKHWINTPVSTKNNSSDSSSKPVVLSCFQAVQSERRLLLLPFSFKWTCWPTRAAMKHL